MRVIPLIVVDDTALVSSNVPETDYVLWSGATTYVAGDRVRTTDHRVFQSAAGGNLNNDPLDPANVVSADNPSAPWIYVSKTNRWRAFDGLNSAKTVQATSITYELLVSRTTEVVAFTGLVGQSVRVEVLDPLAATVFDETRELLDTSVVQTYFQYFTFENTEFVDAAIFYNVSAFAGYTINVTITAVSGGDAEVGIIGYGRRRLLGTLQPGTTPQIADYSTKETNVFGERVLIERAYAREIQFNLAIPTDDYARVERILIPLRATPAIYYQSEDLENNLIVSGIYSDFSPPLAYAMTFATLTVLGDI